MEKIYVQIPAYRDSELAPTLTNIFETASYPHRIRIGVFWQHADDEVLPQAILDNPQIEIISIHYRESNGCNRARRALQQQWKNEEYTLLLDSHHRFVDGWDVKMIDMYQRLRSKGVSKPLLTAYLPPYDPLNDPQDRDLQPLKIYPLSRERGLLIYLIAHKIPLWSWLKEPIPAQFASLHFIFTQGSFNKEMPLDDTVYFFGDEVLAGLRAFTHGYDLYHPHYVLGWHLYNRDNTRITHWNDHTDYNERHERSHTKLRDIFLGVEQFGLGTERTVQDYEHWIGNSLIKC